MGKKINIDNLLRDIHNRSFIYNRDKDQVEDNLSELLNGCKEDTFCYIGTAQFVQDFYENNPDTEWSIRGVFQIGYPFSFPISGVSSNDGKIQRIPKNHPGRKIRECLRTALWSLFVFTKKDFEKVIIGFNNCNDAKLIYRVLDSFEEIFSSVSDEDMLGKPCYLTSYQYIDYYKVIQKTIEKDRLIERKIEYETFRDIDFEFTEVPRESFYIDFLNVLFRYKDSVVDLFGYPDDEEGASDLETEVDIFDEREDIKKGDILFNYLAVNVSERKYKVNLSIAEFDQSKANFKLILRPKTLSAYYVLSFLKSDFVKEFIFSRSKNEQKDVIEVVEEHRDTDDELKFYQDYFIFNYTHNNDEDWIDIDIEKLPIIINHNVDTEYFQKKYEWEMQEKSSIQRRLEKKTRSTFYNQDAKEIILRDMKELRACFNGGTYKAAIILAGSVLEAFLIDWLSEIDDHNYFEEDYMIYDKYRNRYRRADLKDYISSIAELKKPSWFDAAQKATEIRKKRNLVHAKLYINDSDISRETCTEVINYLEYVINTRWGN